MLSPKKIPIENVKGNPTRLKSFLKRMEGFLEVDKKKKIILIFIKVISLVLTMSLGVISKYKFFTLMNIEVSVMGLGLLFLFIILCIHIYTQNYKKCFFTIFFFVNFMLVLVYLFVLSLVLLYNLSLNYCVWELFDIKGFTTAMMSKEHGETVIIKEKNLSPLPLEISGWGYKLGLKRQLTYRDIITFITIVGLSGVVIGMIVESKQPRPQLADEPMANYSLITVQEGGRTYQITEADREELVMPPRMGDPVTSVDSTFLQTLEERAKARERAKVDQTDTAPENAERLRKIARKVKRGRKKKVATEEKNAETNPPSATTTTIEEIKEFFSA